MSGIKGSKSKFYIKEPLPGIEDSSDTLVNVTTGELPGARIGLDVIQHGVYEVNNTGIIGVGSAQRIIECINHGASAGDVMKVTSGNSLDAEIAIIGVIDADNFVIAYEENLSVGDTFSVLRYVSAKYSQDGSLQVSSGPIQFTKNGSAELVLEDTVTPANNEALPAKIFIQKDGIQTAVNKDTGTPANNVAIPVELVGAAGPINITAGDLNVQLTDQGPNADVTRIGDGTNQLSINSDGTIGTKSVGTLSANNSTVANLGIGGTFTGLGDDCLNFGSISIAIYASHDSANLGLQFQASEDGITWYTSDSYNYKATSGMQTYSLAPVARYFRLVYVNGGTATTTLKIQVIYRQFYVKPSSHRIGDTITQENDAELTKSVLTAQKPNGDFTPIDATAAGNLKTSVEEFDNNALNWGAGAADTRTQRVILASDQVMNLPTGAATEATLSAVNGKIPSGLSVASTRLLVDGSGVTQPISATALPLPTGAATDANQTTTNNRLGDLTETAPATDTASSGLNGRLQRIAQRLTSLIALLPASLGQKTSANSLAVVLPSDQVVATRENALSAGTVTDTTISGATVTTILAPVGARGMKIQAGINNTSDLLVGLGGATPNNTTKTGLEFQPGRSEDIQGASNVEVTAYDPAATNQKIVIVWSYV